MKNNFTPLESFLFALWIILQNQDYND